MKKIVFVLMLSMMSIVAEAHNVHYASPVLRDWKVQNSSEIISASFVVEKEYSVVVQDNRGAIHELPKNELSVQDVQWLRKRKEWTRSINQVRVETEKPTNRDWRLFPLIAFVLMLGLWSHRSIKLKEGKSACWPAFFLLVGVSITAFTYSKNQPVEIETDPATIDLAFQPFVPAVHTYYNDTYFYVESRGIPTTHEMMVGISNHGWQQQVPIPQCYVGNNAWPIPLNPILSENPIPVDETHFTRGAIAIAVNGVPIFNVHTNTGVDSYLDGQLDNYGGHCGRADDYHYHIAPLHLYDYTQTSLPIAYGLDGFAVYGSLEPDGSPMQPLDDNHGHVGSDGVYHYHGTAEAPYMIARMAGVVTEDSTHQLIPQAAAHPVRPSLTPLNGALINTCIPNAAGNGYTLGYTLNGQQDSIVYSWTNNGQYTFNFFTTGNGIANTQVYNGFDQCVVPVSISEQFGAPTFEVFPNPCHDVVRLRTSAGLYNECRLYNAEGRCLKVMNLSLTETISIELNDLPNGNYLLECSGKTATSIQKIVKQ